jgi:hypothetical protein
VAGDLILLIEDNPTNRKLIRDVLLFKGYTLRKRTTQKTESAWLKRFAPGSFSWTCTCRAWTGSRP